MSFMPRVQTSPRGANDEPYILVSVASSVSPTGSTEKDWHKYIIAQGHNEIVGHRRGSLEAVQAATNAIVAQLNQRRSGKSTKAQTVIEPAKKGKESIT